MSMKLFELKKKRHEVTQAIEGVLKKAAKESRALNDADLKDLAAHRFTMTELDEAIESRDADNTLSSVVNDIGPGFLFGGGPGPKTQPEESYPTGRKTTLREAIKFASPEQREEIENFTRYTVGGEMSALADLTPSHDGGVFIPTIVAGVIERNIAAFTPVVDHCRVWPTLNGEPTKFPVITDSESATIIVPAALTGADATVSGDHPPTAVGGPTMNAYKFSSLPVFIPRETITDSALDILGEIMYALLARIARYQNLKYTKGSGTGEPTGFLTNATSYAAGSVPLTLDIATDLAYSVPPLYRPNGIYMATDTTIKYLRKLKTGLSGDQRALWKDAFEEGNATLGTPAKLHGYPIIVNNDMDSVASDGTFTGVSPLVFGDFQRFLVRQAEQGSPYVYRYPVPAKDGGAVIAFQRSDSTLLVNTAISKLTVS